MAASRSVNDCLPRRTRLYTLARAVQDDQCVGQDLDSAKGREEQWEEEMVRLRVIV